MAYRNVIHLLDALMRDIIITIHVGTYAIHVLLFVSVFQAPMTNSVFQALMTNIDSLARTGNTPQKPNIVNNLKVLPLESFEYFLGNIAT